MKMAAFAAIYFVWGSTYLAIQLVAETLPAFIMIGMRFFLAGLVLYVFARLRGLPRPTLAHWRSASLSGILLLCLGTGGVVWGVKHLDSGLVALLVSTEPLWLALLIWIWPGGRRPTLGTFGALALGFCGAALLAAPAGDNPVRMAPLLAVLVACVAWAFGSLYSRDADLPASPVLASAIQMLAGGAGLIAFGLAIGEAHRFDPQTVSATSLLAFIYLVVFGSLVAFSAFSWLIRTTDPTLVMTHTYVNPVVAVFLGWLIAGEAVGPRTVVASVLIVGAVILLTTSSLRREREPAPADKPSPKPEAPMRELERCA